MVATTRFPRIAIICLSKGPTARRRSCRQPETAIARLGDRIVVEEMDPLQLKGFSDSIRAFKLVAVQDVSQPAAQPK